MTRAVPQAALDFIKAHEGRGPVVYADVAGVLTGGYGHVTTLPLGTNVPDTLADEWLAEDAAIAAGRLTEKIKATIIDQLTDNQWSALIDFSVNLGTPGTTIWRDLNARNFDQVPADLMAFTYIHVNGKPVKVQGLVNRRADEVKLWSTGEPGSVDAAPSSAVTRSYATPAAPSDPKARGGIGPAIATAATAAAAAAPQAGQAVKSVSDALSPYASANTHVQAAVSTLALIAAILAAVTVILVYLRNRAVSRWEPTIMPSLPAGSLSAPIASPDPATAGHA